MNQIEIHEDSHKSSHSFFPFESYVIIHSSNTQIRCATLPTLELFTESNSGMSTWDGDLILHPENVAVWCGLGSPPGLQDANVTTRMTVHIIMGNPKNLHLSHWNPGWEVDPRYGDPKPSDTNLRPQNLLGWSWGYNNEHHFGRVNQSHLKPSLRNNVKTRNHLICIDLYCFSKKQTILSHKKKVYLLSIYMSSHEILAGSFPGYPQKIPKNPFWRAVGAPGVCDSNVTLMTSSKFQFLNARRGTPSVRSVRSAMAEHPP